MLNRNRLNQNKWRHVRACWLVVFLSLGHAGCVLSATATGNFSKKASPVEVPETPAVSPVNVAPTQVLLSNWSVDENAISGTKVGTLTTSDPNTADTFLYTLSGPDASHFVISGDSLLTNGLVNDTTRSSYSVSVVSKDQGGLASPVQLFTISIVRVIPNAPFALGAQSGLNAQILLTWLAPKTGPAPAKYKLYRSLSTGVPTAGAALAEISAPALTYSDTSVTNGVRYFYKVVASNAGIDSVAQSHEASAMPQDSSSTVQDLSTLYVAAAGNDTTGNGSIGNPYATLAKGVLEVNSGGFVVVKDGTYPLVADLAITKSVTIQSATGDFRTSAAVFQGPATGVDPTKFSANANNISFLGIEGINLGFAFTSPRSGVVFRNSYFRDLNNSWLQSNATGPQLTNFTLDGNEFRNIGVRNPAGGGPAFAVVLNYWGAATNSGFSIVNNVFENIAWSAIQTYTGGVVINNNHFKNTCDAGVFVYSLAPTQSGTFEVSNNLFERSSATGGSVSFPNQCRASGVGVGNVEFASGYQLSVINNRFVENGVAVNFHSDYGRCRLDLFSGTILFVGNSIDASNAVGLKMDCDGNFSASNNYWGHALGPTYSLNAGGVGAPIDVVSGTFDFLPFLTDR